MKKFLTYSVVVATIAWSMGLSAVLPAAAAYSPADGDLIKTATYPAVYYVTGGKKYLFVNRVTYTTWSNAVGDANNSFAGLKVVSQADFDALPLGGNVTARPGVSLVKFDNSAAVYAVTPGAVLVKLADSAAMTALYGTAAPILIQSSFEANYTKSATVLTATSNYPDGALVSNAGTNYLVSGGQLQAVSGDAFTANNFKSSWVHAVSSISGYTVGSAVSGKVSSVSDIVAGVGTPTTTLGALSVSLAAANPATATIIGDAANGAQVLVPFLAINLTASSAGDVKVTGMQFERTGISADSDVITTYLYDGKAKLLEGGSLSTKKLSFNASNGIITIPAGQTKTVMLKTDMVAGLSAGKSVGFNLTGVTSNATSVSGTPLTGNLMSTANVDDAGYVSISTNAAPATADVAVNAGEVQFEALKFTLTANDQDVQVEGIRATQIGSVAIGDLQNINLTVGGTVLASGTLDANNEVYFDLSASPYKITKGNAKTLSVKVDAVKGTTKTFKFALQYAADLVIKDLGYGTYAPTYPSGTTWTAQNPAGNYKISSGSISFTKDATSPSGSIAGNSTNVKLATYKLTATGEDIKVKSLNVVANSGDTGLQNGKIYFDGVQVGSTKNLTEDTQVNFTFGSSFIVPAGTSKLMDVYGDIKNVAGTAITSGTISVSASTTDAQGVVSLTSVTLSTVAGNTLSVGAVSTITMAKYVAYGNQTMTSPATNVKIGSFTVAAAANEGVVIDNIYFRGATSGELDGGLTFNVGGTNIITKDTLPSVNTATTTVSMGNKLTLAAGETKVVDIYSNIKSGLSTASITLIVAADGTTPNTNTAATAGGATLQTITVGAGSLSVDTSASKPDANIVIAGATTEVTRVFFNAANESFTITNLTVSSTVYNLNTTSSASSRSIGSIILEYPKKDGTTGTATGYLNSSNKVNFNNLSFYVGRNVGATLKIKVAFSSIGSGAQSGDYADFNVNPSDDTEATFAATGENSGSRIYAYTGSSGVTGNKMYVRRTRPTVSLVTLPSTVLTDGTKTISRFSISADSAGDVTWKAIGFTLSSSSGVTITDSTVKLYKDGDDTALNTATSVVNPTNRDTIKVTTTDEQTITKGTSQTYVLKATVAGSAANRSLVVNVGINSGATTAGTSTDYTALANYETSFLWSDRAGGSTLTATDDAIHTGSTFDWCDSNYVKSLPTDSQTLSQ